MKVHFLLHVCFLICIMGRLNLLLTLSALIFIYSQEHWEDKLCNKYKVS